MQIWFVLYKFTCDKRHKKGQLYGLYHWYDRNGIATSDFRSGSSSIIHLFDTVLSYVCMYVCIVVCMYCRSLYKKYTFYTFNYKTWNLRTFFSLFFLLLIPLCFYIILFVSIFIYPSYLYHISYNLCIRQTRYMHIFFCIDPRN